MNDLLGQTYNHIWLKAPYQSKQDKSTNYDQPMITRIEGMLPMLFLDHMTWD